MQPVRDALSSILTPIRSAGDAAFNPISNGSKGVFGYDDVKKENDKLRAKLEDAKGDAAELVRLKVENRELKKLNGVSAGTTKTRTARVVAAQLSSFDQSVEIDQGSGDGIKKGMAVITGLSRGAGGGIFGRIQETRGGRSKVELITSPSFVAGVTVGGERGVLEGQGRGRALLIDQIPSAAKLAKGDYVYTSGIEDTAFPADLKVGRVRSVKTSADGQYLTVEVTPLADLASVYVKVVLKDPPR